MRSLCWSALVVALASPVAIAAPSPALNDAPLRAVQFVDRNEGWAVGDRGVVWHTIDGGASWERQPAGTRASLRALHFLTPYLGWIAGREERPGGVSCGVVLATTDGGITWERVSELTVPGLNAVHFFDGRTGLVAGDGCDQFPGGLFLTRDGGRSWSPSAGPRSATWLAADFSNPTTGIAGAAAGRMASIHDGRLMPVDVDTLSGRSVCALRLDGQHATAVGQGGLLMVSRDSAGVSWAFARSPLPKAATTCCDYFGLAQVGTQRWAVGRPGSIVLHSADQGEHWEALSTGQPVPLNAVCFIDENHGWAVGELGTILATTDGGKTWKAQRRGGQRAAVLCVQSSAAELPCDVAALLGGADGYLTVGLRVTNPTDGPARTSEPQRLAAAWRACGGASAEALWQFPIAPHQAGLSAPDLLATWDRLHGGHAADMLLRQMVLAIRVWRPEVVLTGGHNSAADVLTAQAVAEAFRRAGDPKQFPEQIENLHLQAWQPKKLYFAQKDQSGASVVIDATEPQARLGDSPRDFAAPATALLTADTSTTVRAFRLVGEAGLPGAAKATAALMAGIDLAPGGTARRELPPLLPGAEAAAAQRVRAKRNLLAISGNAAGALGGPDRALAQVNSVLKKLPSSVGARVAYAVAQQYVRNGQWHLARETFLVMVDRYPADPLAVEAYRWLVRYHGSSEARRRHELGQFLIASETSFRVLPGANAQPKPGETPPNGTRNSTEEEQTTRLTLFSSQKSARRWYEGCLAAEPRLSAFGPLFAADPAVQFPLQAARRALADFTTPAKWYHRYLELTAPPPGLVIPPGTNGFRDAAAMELWLSNHNGPPPKPLGICRQISTRPFLDGQLADACWDGLPPLVLKPAVGKPGKEYATQARFAFDAEYLYVAVECKHPADKQLPPAQKRTRDADLSGSDRVELMLDLDRDYQTYFHLVVDQRGCYAEDCWGDQTWNPRWFIAVKDTPTGWTAELAIPLLELTAEHVPPGRLWAANVIRVLPGRGVLAWSTPAGATPKPEGMGVLLFGQEQKPKARH